MLVKIKELFRLGQRHNRVEWWVVDRNDHSIVKSHGVSHNLVVDASRPFVGDLVRGYSFSSPLRALAIGSNNDGVPGPTDPNNNIAVQTIDTKLNDEIGSAGSPTGRAELPVAGTDTTSAKNTISGNVVTLRQLVDPSAAVTVREMGLFGDIPDLTTPTAALTVDSNDTTLGTLPPSTTYHVRFTYYNAAGETAGTTSGGSHTSLTTPSDGGNDNSFVFTAGSSLPAGAVGTKVYGSTTGSGGAYTLMGMFVGTNTGRVTTPPNGTTAIPTTNNLNAAGEYESGRLFNRAFIGPATLAPADTIIIEVQITFG